MSAIVLEEASRGELAAWQSPRWFETRGIRPLMRVRLDLSRPKLAIPLSQECVFPEYRVLQVETGAKGTRATFYAPFNLETLNLQYHGWEKLRIEGILGTSDLEELADLSRHIYITTDPLTEKLLAHLGDLRAIHSPSFRLLPEDIRDVIEEALQSLEAEE